MFRKLLILYGALVLGQLVFAMVSLFLITSDGWAHQPDPIMGFRFVIPGAMIGAATLSWFLNNMFRQQTEGLLSLDQKLAHYRKRVIVRLAILEGANLLAIVGGLLTGHYNYFLLFLIGMALFIFFRPSKNEIRNDYNLTPEEEQQL